MEANYNRVLVKKKKEPAQCPFMARDHYVNRKDTLGCCSVCVESFGISKGKSNKHFTCKEALHFSSLFIHIHELIQDRHGDRYQNNIITLLFFCCDFRVEGSILLHVLKLFL